MPGFVELVEQRIFHIAAEVDSHTFVYLSRHLPDFGWFTSILA